MTQPKPSELICNLIKAELEHRLHYYNMNSDGGTINSADYARAKERFDAAAAAVDRVFCPQADQSTD